MTELIPTAIAAHLIEAKLQASEQAVRHMVLHEAVALLIGDLHRQGLTDAPRLAAALEQAFAAPEIRNLSPQAPEVAELLAARIRHAATESADAAHDMSQGR